MKKPEIKLDISTPEKYKRNLKALKLMGEKVEKYSYFEIEDSEYTELFFSVLDNIWKPSLQDDGLKFVSLSELIQILEEEQNPLSGKVAIQVENEREFKCLMEHYDGKGWRALNSRTPIELIKLNNDGLNGKFWRFHDRFNGDEFEPDGYRIIPFKEFVKLAGIDYRDEVRVGISMGLQDAVISKDSITIAGLIVSHSEIEQIHKACQEFK